MKVAIISKPFGLYASRGMSTVPRIGDSVDLIHNPPPKVVDVVWFIDPNKLIAIEEEFSAVSEFDMIRDCEVLIVVD